MSDFINWRNGPSSRAWQGDNTELEGFCFAMVTCEHIEKHGAIASFTFCILLQYFRKADM